MTSVCTCFDREMPLDFYYPGDDGGNKEFFKRYVNVRTIFAFVLRNEKRVIVSSYFTGYITVQTDECLKYRNY